MWKKQQHIFEWQNKQKYWKSEIKQTSKEIVIEILPEHKKIKDWKTEHGID